MTIEFNNSGQRHGYSKRPQTTQRWVRSVERVLVYMREHLEEEHSSEGLADIGALSRFHFNRVFRQVTGLPPAHYLTALRIEMAKHRLVFTDQTVTDICFDAGYSSLGTFVSRFTQLVGISPGALRRTARAMQGADLRLLCGQDVWPRESALTPSISGRIDAEDNRFDVIFVALYDSHLPHGRPRFCSTLAGPGYFSFCPVPDGSYTLAAAAVEPIVAPVSFLDHGVTARAALGPIEMIGGAPVQDIVLAISPQTTLFPPILAPLPAMLAAARGGRPESCRLTLF
jgi:AraC-like DNA-binding protein